jgi:hypothetical protein
LAGSVKKYRSLELYPVAKEYPSVRYVAELMNVSFVFAVVFFTQRESVNGWLLPKLATEVLAMMTGKDALKAREQFVPYGTSVVDHIAPLADPLFPLPDLSPRIVPAHSVKSQIPTA